MPSKSSLNIVMLMLFLFLPTFAASAQDLLEAYGTESIDCAEDLFEAIEASRAMRHEHALELVERAIKHDNGCELAHYWHSLILLDNGRGKDSERVSSDLIQRSLRSLGPRESVSNIVIEAMIGMGVAHGRRGELVESAGWLSKAVIFAGNSQPELQGKAYRNLAITTQQMGQRERSALLALKARPLNPNLVGSDMVSDYIARAGFPEWFTEASSVDELIAALVLYNELDSPDFQFLEESIEAADPVIPNAAKLPQLLRDEELEKTLPASVKPSRLYTHEAGTIILSEESPYCFVVSNSGEIREFEVAAPVSAVAGDSEKILLAATGVNRIDEYSRSGERVNAIQVNAPIRDMVLCPHTGLLFYIDHRSVIAHDLETGVSHDSGMRGLGLKIHPTSQRLYAVQKPKQFGSSSESGHIIVNGRPIFFHSTNSSAGFEYQDGLFVYAYGNDGFGSLVAARAKATVNFANLDLSASGNFVSVTGGGGYRPNSGDGGYGAAIFDATNVKRVEGFYRSEAYPRSVAFSPDDRYLAIATTVGVFLYHTGAPHESSTVDAKLKGWMAWSADGKRLFVLTESDRLQIYRLDHSALPGETTN